MKITQDASRVRAEAQVATQAPSTVSEAKRRTKAAITESAELPPQRATEHLQGPQGPRAKSKTTGPCRTPVHPAAVKLTPEAASQKMAADILKQVRKFVAGGHGDLPVISSSADLQRLTDTWQAARQRRATCQEAGESIRQVLEMCGFTCERFGDGTIQIHDIPHCPESKQLLKLIGKRGGRTFVNLALPTNVYGQSESFAVHLNVNQCFGSRERLFGTLAHEALHQAKSACSDKGPSMDGATFRQSTQSMGGKLLFPSDVYSNGIVSFQEVTVRDDLANAGLEVPQNRREAAQLASTWLNILDSVDLTQAPATAHYYGHSGSWIHIPVRLNLGAANGFFDASKSFMQAFMPWAQQLNDRTVGEFWVRGGFECLEWTPAQLQSETARLIAEMRKRAKAVLANEMSA